MSNNLPLLFLNFNSALNKLCNEMDVLFLKENLIMSNDLGIFDSISSDFFLFSISCAIVSEILSGKPCDHLTILWCKTVGLKSRDIILDDNRLLEFHVEYESRKYLLLTYTCRVHLRRI